MRRLLRLRRVGAYMFGKRKSAVIAHPGPPRISVGAVAPDGPVVRVEVPAIALLCDVAIGFTDDEALRGFAAGVLRARWPALEVDPTIKVEAASGQFNGNDEQAKALLTPMLKRAMASARVDDPQRYEMKFFSARTDSPPATVWCMAAIAPATARLTIAEQRSYQPDVLPQENITDPAARVDEITARLTEIDKQLSAMRSRIEAAFTAPSDAPGADILIAAIEEKLGRKPSPSTPTPAQIEILEKERDALQAELALVQQH